MSKPQFPHTERGNGGREREGLERGEREKEREREGERERERERERESERASITAVGSCKTD